MLVPKLRFRPFENDLWYDYRLGDICSFEQGIQVDIELQSMAGGEDKVRFLRIENYTQNSNDFRYIPKKLSRAKSITRDELAVVRYGATAGYIGRGFDGVLANNLFKLVPCEEIMHLNFFYHIMKSDKTFRFFQSEMSGGAMPALSFGIVKVLKLAIPKSKIEQQKIADFLSAVEKKISLLKEKHALLKQYKNGVMQKLLKREIRFKDDNGNAFPDWQELKFGDVFERVTRKNKTNNLNVLTISAQRGLINQEKYFNKSVSAKDVTGYYLLENGEFAYNKSYSKGYPMGAIKRLNNYDRGVVSTLYICFKTAAGQYDQFWEQYFEAGNLNREISKIAQEGARNHGLLNISVTEFFRDMDILVPDVQEQEKIASFMQVIDKKIDATNEQIELTQTFKKGLLQQMFI